MKIYRTYRPQPVTPPGPPGAGDAEPHLLDALEAVLAQGQHALEISTTILTALERRACTLTPNELAELDEIVELRAGLFRDMRTCQELADTLARARQEPGVPEAVVAQSRRALQLASSILTGLDHGAIALKPDEAIELRGAVVRDMHACQSLREALAAARKVLGVPRHGV